jgi:phosphopantetheinyl transferase
MDRSVVHAAYLCAQHLPPCEVARLLSFRRAEDRLRSLVAQYLIRKAAADHFNLELGAVSVGRTELGRPFLLELAGDVSVAHSGSYVVSAFASEGRVGVDIEQVRRLSQISDGTLTGAPRHAGPQLSLRRKAELWVLKESAVKYVGTGFRHTVSEVNVEENGRRPYHVIVCGTASGANLWLLEAPSGFAMAVADDAERSPQIVET